MNRLKERRLELGLTQEAVSGILKLADVRMDVSMVSRFENGVCLPTEEVTEALEAALRRPDARACACIGVLVLIGGFFLRYCLCTAPFMDIASYL